MPSCPCRDNFLAAVLWAARTNQYCKELSLLVGHVDNGSGMIIMCGYFCMIGTPLDAKAASCKQRNPTISKQSMLHVFDSWQHGVYTGDIWVYDGICLMI